MSAKDSYEEVMTEAVSYRWENKELLLKTIMAKLNITEDDLENDPSWMRAKVREMNIEKVLN